MQLDHKFWNNKRVLVTGHTGFKGSWLVLWLIKMGAQVTGIALKPNSTPNIFDALDYSEHFEHIVCDIRDGERLDEIIQKTSPEIVFHLAAQPLVRKSYRDPIETFSTNVMGTANLLQSLIACDDLRVAVMITTDKVYHNHEWIWPYKETDQLGGHDPYSASKAASELVIESYRKSFYNKPSVGIASARAGNVIGGGDWSEDRLIPDAIKAWESGTALNVRNPNARRPWQHVLEPLNGYLVLAEKLWSNKTLEGSFNFGPQSNDSASVGKVIELAHSFYGKGDVEMGNVIPGPHEAGLLTLETSKAREVLNIVPRWSLDKAVEMTTMWYKQFYAGKPAIELCLQNIQEFENDLHK